MPSPLKQFLLLAVSMAGISAHAAEPILDWDELDPNAPLPAFVGTHIYLGGAKPDSLRLVTSETLPANPFPNSPAAISVNVIEGDPFFRGWGRAFLNGGKPKGFFEFHFRLEEGGAAFTVGQNATPYEERVLEAFAFLNPGDEFVAADFVAGQLATIQHNKVATSSKTELSTGVNYLFRVEWDFTSDTPGFRFFLDGNPLENVADNTPFFWPANETQVQRGVDSFSFSSTSPGSGFFGNIGVGQGD